MALPFKTYATISGTRYRIFKPKEFPEQVFAYDTQQKIVHRINEPILKLLNIDKTIFRPYQIPDILKGMKTGKEWNESWYKKEFSEKGPVKIRLEPKRISGLEEIKELSKKVLYGQKSEEVRRLQDLLKGAGYFPTPQLSTGYFGPITKQAITAFEKGQIKWPDYKTIPTQKGYALIREKDTLEVYTLDPKTGQVRWLTKEAVRPAGFDLVKVTEVPRGYVGQFKTGEKWSKLKLEIPILKEDRKESEIKRWAFETRAKSIKGLEGYVDFLYSPVSVKTAQTTPAIIIKPVEKTKADFIAEELKDYSKISKEKKDQLAKKHLFNSDYGTELIKRANIEIQKIVSEEMQKVGFKDPTTGEEKFPLALDLDTAVKEINQSITNFTNLEKEALEKTKEYQIKLKEAATYEGQSDAIYKIIDRLETEIIFERTEEFPDKERIRKLDLEIKKEAKKVTDINLKYRTIVNSVNDSLSDLKKIEAKMENERAKHIEENMSVKWANFYTLQEYNRNMEVKIKEWIRVEEKGIIQLYETGKLSIKETLEMLNANIPDIKNHLTPKTFQDFLSEGSKRRRKSALKYTYTQTAMEAKDLRDKYNVGLEALKSVSKNTLKTLFKTMEISAAKWTVPFQLLQDIKDIRGMSAEIDALAEALPSLEEVAKMNDNQKAIYLDSLLFLSETADKVLKETPELKTKTDFVKYITKSIADKVYNPNWSEVSLYKAMEGDTWVPKEYQTQAKIVLGIALGAAMWRDAKRNEGFYTDAFKNINKKIIFKLGGKEKQTVIRFLGQSLKNTLGVGYSKYIEGPYGIPNIGNVLRSSLAKGYEKAFPVITKLKIQRVLSRYEKAEAKQMDRVQKIINQLAPDQAARIRLMKIASGEIIPEEIFIGAKKISRGRVIKGKTLNELRFEFLGELDPNLYGELNKLRNFGYQLDDIPVLLKHLTKGNKLKKEAEFISLARSLGGKAEKWMQHHIVQLRVHSVNIIQRKKYIKMLNKEFGKSITRKIVDLEGDLKKFSDNVRNIHGKLGKPVKIPWAKTKGINSYNWFINEKAWKKFKLPKDASGSSLTVQGSKQLAKYSKVKEFSNPDKTFRINFIRKSFSRTIDDASATSFHEAAHTIIDVKGQKFFNNQLLDDFLIANFEIKILKNPELRKAFNLIIDAYIGVGKRISPIQRKALIKEFYAYMVEVQSAVNSNLKLSLRTWKKLSAVSENKISQVRNTFAKLAKRDKLFNKDELRIFFPQLVTEKEARFIIKKYGEKQGREMIKILECGLEIDVKKIPYFEPYRRGFVEVKSPPLINKINKEINNRIPKLVPGYLDPKIYKKMDSYELVPGMMRSITRRTNVLKAEDFIQVAKELGHDSKMALIKYTKAALDTGKYPRIDPVVAEFLGKSREFINALRKGKIIRAQKNARIKIIKILNKEKEKSYYNSKQREAIKKWMRQFEEKENISLESVKETRSALGLYSNIKGIEALKLWDLELIGGSKHFIAGPLWLKRLGTGSWKQLHPKQANIFRGIMTVLNFPQTLWKYSVLFLRPGWGVRNIMDNSLKMGLVSESGQKAKSWKIIAKTMTPVGWKSVKKELQAKTAIGRMFESTTMFIAENPTFNNQSMKTISFWLMDKSGAFGKYSNRAFQTILKRKRGLENIYTQTEIMAKEGLMLNATFKYADDAVRTLWDDIIKTQQEQKNILFKLRELLPGKKNFNKVSKIAQDLVRGKLKVADKNWILKNATKYKMKEGRILEKGFVEVERILFDYSDLSKIGKGLRWIYPFWGFFSKNFILWSESVAKQPGLRRCAIFYLKKIEEANSDLPDWYKKRIKVFGNYYTLPIFSYQQVADVWLNPFQEFERWMKNKNHPISGLGWNPSITVGIKKFTGKGYFSEEKDLKSLGYTDEMLKRLGIENYDIEQNRNVFAIYARTIPIFQLISTFEDISNEMLVTMDSAVRSKKLNAFMSYFFGVPLIKIDDLNKLWGAYNRMLPQDKSKFLAAIPKGQYENFCKLLAAKNLQKILNATERGVKDPIYFQRMYDFEYRLKYWEVLNLKGDKEAKYLLATNPAIKEAMDRFWNLLEFSPKRAATEYIYNKNLVRGVTFQILKQLNNELKEGMKTRPAEWFAVTGEGYELAYTKEDLRNDIFREDGTLIPETFEELQAMMPQLKNLPWLKKIVEESISKSEEFPEEYYRLRIETNKEEEDFKYYVEMVTFGKTIFIDSEPGVESTPQARGAALRAGYDLWDNMSSTTKALHLERYPAKNVWHEFKSSYVKKLGVMISQGNIENWFENFYDDNFFGIKDREVYFIKHPDRKIYYPFALENAKLSKQDKLNRDKGEFTNYSSEYLRTLDPKIKAIWGKDKPQFWESYRWHEGYQVLIKAGRFTDGMDFYWSAKYKGPRNRYFLKNPKEKKFRILQKDHWTMPQNTWEEKHKALDWWFAHSEYIKWTHRYDITKEQKADSALRDRLKKINYEIKPEGTGEVFYNEMAKLEAEKRMIYEKNPQLQEEFEKGLRGEAKAQYDLTQRFFEIDIYDFEAKQKFLLKYPQLKIAWNAMTPSWERTLLDLQAKYFALKTSKAKEEFLKKHPELVQYWETKTLPWSYWFNKAKFKKDKAIIISIVTSIEKNQLLTDKEKEIIRQPEDEDERYIANKVYQWAMGKWIEHGRIDTNKGWDFFQNLPEIIKNIYFLKNPKMKQYFGFTSEWHRKLQIDSKDGAAFFNSSINKEWRDMYYDRHPEAKKFFEQLGELSVMPDKTWEDNQKIRRWWEQHDELSEWLRRRETKEEKIFREIKESYFAILERIPLVGSGTDFWIRYFKVQKEADDFLSDHSELRDWFKEYRKGDERILKLQDEYFKIDNPELRNQFLKENLDLKDSWYDKASPKKREVMELQEAYFAIPKNSYAERNKFLIDNSELLAYWNAQALPHQYYFEPKQFKKINYNLNLLQDYYNVLIDSTHAGEIAFAKLPDEIQKAYKSGELNQYEKNRAYLMAMNTWIKVINKNFLRGNYYFKSLPVWIRKRYFKAHPEKQFMFSIPLEDFILEPLKEWEKEHPQLAWAYRIMYDYGKISHVPNELAKKVEEIFIKEGIWEDRKKWDKIKWRDYWKELALLKHEIREEDIKRLPQLQEAIERAARQYPMKPRAKPLFRTKPRKGFMKPFI